MIKTNRLKIYPATKSQMEIIIASQDNDEIKKAYSEMLENSLKYPDKYEWYAMWLIELKNGTHIGELCFKGLNSKGVTEIGYGISEEYKNHGYATEAVKAITEWAFENPDVTAIEAETDNENIASKKVLEKCGFILNGEQPHFKLLKNREED